MQLIEQLEPVRRGPYGRRLRLARPGRRVRPRAVVIRTAVGSRAAAPILHVGGAIVADSDPAEEYEESL